MAQQKNNRVSLRLDDVEMSLVKKASLDSGFGTAKQSGAARYAKAVVLGHNPPSIFDQKVLIEVCNLHAHLGKIGGLFKLAIDGDIGEENIHVYLSEILKTQKDIKREDIYYNY